MTTKSDKSPDPDLSRFLKLHYDPLGNAFEETFLQWLRRNLKGLAVPITLLVIGTAAALTVAITYAARG